MTRLFTDDTKKVFESEYVKHFIPFSKTRFLEGTKNGHVIVRDGNHIVGTGRNSMGFRSKIEGKLYNIGPLRIGFGRATGYKFYPNGAPYALLGLAIGDTRHFIMPGTDGTLYGIVYMKLKRTK